MFFKNLLCQSLDMMVSYYHVQYQKKLMIQSWENVGMDRRTDRRTDRRIDGWVWYQRNPNSRKWRKTSFWAWCNQNLSKNTASLVWCMDICLAIVKFACRHYMSSLLVSLCDIICDNKLWYFCTMYIIDRNMCYVMSFMSSAKIALFLRTTKLSEQ